MMLGREPTGHEPRAMQRGLLLLEAVAEIGPGATARQLADHTGIPRATAYKLLNLLVADGYLVRIADLSGFALGIRTRQLAATPAEPDGDRNALVLDSIRGSTRHGVFLAAFADNRIRLVDLDPDHELPDAASIVDYPHSSAVGKIWLASRPAVIHPDHHRLHRVTDHTITDPPTLASHLEQVRATGVAHEIDESRCGRSAVAVAVTGRRSQVTGALAVIGRTGRLAVAEPSLLELVRSHAARIHLPAPAEVPTER